jgi:predicted nucleotidyltransferase
MSPETSHETAALVAKLRECLRGRQDVHVALLFGSQARGRTHAGSDIDLAVQGGGLDLLALARDLSLATNREVDVVNLDRVGYPLIESILRDAIFVHQGRPGAAGRWLSHTVADLETDRPNFQRMHRSYLKHLAGKTHGR